MKVRVLPSLCETTNHTARKEMKVKMRMKVPPAADAGAQAQTCAGTLS